MKNFYFKLPKLQILVLFVLMSSTGFAQQVITEYSRVNPESPFKYQHHFDESTYTKVLDENGKKVFLQNQPITQNAPEGENNTEDVTLTINLDFDPAQFHADFIISIYNETGYYNMVFWFGFPATVVLPEGNYDIMATFFNFNSGKEYKIIKEQQNIMGDTTISLNPVDADNYISVNAYDENGEILQPGVENPDTGFPSTILFTRQILFNPSGASFGSSYFWQESFDGDPIWNFYINDLSERYSISHYFIGADYEAGSYFTKFETLQGGVSANASLENNPDTWVYHTERFQPSNLDTGGVYPGFITSPTFEGRLLTGWSLYSLANSIDPEEAFKGFLNNAFDDDPTQFLVTPAIVDLIYPLTEQVLYIKGDPVVSDGNGGVLYGSGDLTSQSSSFPILANDYYMTENDYLELLPLHPKFTFSSDTNSNPKQGNNVPIVISAVNVVPDQTNAFKYQNKGRYGEKRESDFFATQAEVKQNGDVVFSGGYIEFMSYNFPTSGNIEVMLSNSNTQVEELEGKNTTIITYDASEEDAPPTLQHLQFRRSGEEVSSIFDSTEDLTVRLAAGDFQYHMINDLRGYYTYNEGSTVELYYSLYNQDNWTELELTEYPEYFQMPAFGDYYEASLSSVVVPEDNSWFDVRIICTDAAGNKQEQVISPAFKIEQATMGIEETDKSGFTVYPNPFTNELNIQLPENIKGNYTFKVVDASGKMIYSEHNKSENKFVWNGSSLPKGVYILSIESNGKVMAKKVIKK